MTEQKADPLSSPHSVDEMLRPGTLLLMGLQHVLVMYAGNVAVPLLVGQGLKLPPSQTAFLINAGLLASGIATLIQSLGAWKFGARLPIMMGSTFLSVAPAISMGSDPRLGLPAFYGALLVSGVVGIVAAALIGRMLGLFPPVVTGTLITLLGVSLLSVAMNWAGGGVPFHQRTVAGESILVPDRNFGAPSGLALAGFVLLVILLLSKYGQGMLRRLAIMSGIVAGVLLSLLLGNMHLDALSQASWFAWSTPFHFGAPTFHLGPIVTMCLVMIITLVESTGVFYALADITGRQLSRPELVRALRGDGLGIVAGAVFNAFPFTSYSQNLGLISVTGVHSRFVCAAGGFILILLGLLPKLAYVVALVPQPVLGGAGLIMFGMVAATGIRILSTVDFGPSTRNMLVVSLSLAIGLIPTLAPRLFEHLPAWSRAVTESGVVLGTLAAVILNQAMNGRTASEVVQRH